jgi:hypothetical protein
MLSGDFDFELVTDPDSGLVLDYGDDLWRASSASIWEIDRANDA